MLGKRHCTAVKPAVYNLCDPGHGSAAFIAFEVDIIHIWPVKLYALIYFFHSSLCKLFSGAYGSSVAALASPYI
ncbi:hypothetical protein SDC9_159278 [bioreactor metagenome]|uniref:Uncharacterized protein n=1 Tax=bioreactor metagenome TaxID=1076179 RepID=A0A645FF48_9ZZZZ